MKESTWARLAALTAYTLWGFTFLASSRCQEYASPLVLLAVRFSLAFLVMVIPAALMGKLSYRGKPVGRILLTALCEPVIYFIGEQYGLKYTNSSFSGLAIALIPVVAMLAGVVFLREKPTGKQWLCSILSISGVAAIALMSRKSGGTITGKGVLFLLMAVVSAAVYGVLIRACSRYFSVIETTVGVQAVGAACFLAMALAESRGSFSPILGALREPGFLLPSLYLVLGASVIGYLFINFSMSRVPIMYTVSLSSLVTVLSVITGALVLDEPFTVWMALAMIPVLFGIWGVQSFGAEKADEKQETQL